MNGEEIAQVLGVHYDGIQPGWLGIPDSWQFTDVATTGSTFHARSLEEAHSKLSNMRRKFELGSCQIKYTEKDLERVGEALEINPADYPELLEGMNTELPEHCDFSDGDAILNARIAISHLRENKNYYSILKKAGL